MEYQGRCHCGQIRFVVSGELTRVIECNCSICRCHGSLHWLVAPSAFQLLSSPEQMRTYTFNRHIIQHHFCPVCGCATHNDGVTPDGKPVVAVNARAIEGIELDSLPVLPFDGRAL